MSLISEKVKRSGKCSLAFLQHQYSYISGWVLNGDPAKYQNKLKALLDEVDSFCKKHKLNYWIEMGAVLGSMRHGAMVPWDYDLDIALVKEDWDVLHKLIGKSGTVLGKLRWEWEEGVWRAYMGDDDDTWADVMKYVEHNGILWPQLTQEVKVGEDVIDTHGDRYPGWEKEYIFPLSKMPLWGRYYNGPANPDQIISHFYPGWRVVPWIPWLVLCAWHPCSGPGMLARRDEKKYPVYDASGKVMKISPFVGGEKDSYSWGMKNPLEDRMMAYKGKKSDAAIVAAASSAKGENNEYKAGDSTSTSTSTSTSAAASSKKRAGSRKSQSAAAAAAESETEDDATLELHEAEKGPIARRGRKASTSSTRAGARGGSSSSRSRKSASSSSSSSSRSTATSPARKSSQSRQSTPVRAARASSRKGR